MDPSATPQALAVDMKTAAAMCCLSVKTLDRAIKRGELAVVRAGRKKVILCTDLDDYLKRNRGQAPAPSKPVKKKVTRTGADSNGRSATGNPHP